MAVRKQTSKRGMGAILKMYFLVKTVRKPSTGQSQMTFIWQQIGFSRQIKVWYCHQIQAWDQILFKFVKVIGTQPRCLSTNLKSFKEVTRNYVRLQRKVLLNMKKMKSWTIIERILYFMKALENTPCTYINLLRHLIQILHTMIQNLNSFGN